MHDFLVSTVAFIVLIGLMVLVHEFGHFLVAKLCGVRVERFSIGFPPRLFGFKIGDTDYCISATPLGGYVKMTGENMPGENMQMEGADQDPIEAQKEDPGALTSHPRWQRILIAMAGPVANFVLALVLMFVYFGWINEVPVVQVKSTTLDWVVPGTAAAQAGMQPGDVIERFASIKNPSWNQVYVQIKINANEQVPVVVDRDNKTVDLSLQVPASAKSDRFRSERRGHPAQDPARADRGCRCPFRFARRRGRIASRRCDRVCGWVAFAFRSNRWWLFFRPVRVSRFQW